MFLYRVLIRRVVLEVRVQFCIKAPLHLCKGEFTQSVILQTDSEDDGNETSFL